MNWTRVGLIGFVGLCAWAAWPKGQSPAPPRPLLIKAALKDASDPVVMLGDSIVALANFPRTVCGRPVVNAGIGGSTTASGLDAMLLKALSGKRAAMIVVSLGLNDSAVPLTADVYKTNYLSMLSTLKPATSQLAVATVTPAEAGLPEAAIVRTPSIDSYNAVLPDIADASGARLIAIPAMPAKHTIDGIHLNAEGYAIWTKALFGGVEAALCKSS